MTRDAAREAEHEKALRQARTLRSLGYAPVADTIDALLAEIAALRRALEEHAIHAEYDYPGDAPELCGYTCQICKGFGGRNEDVEHETSCVLSSPAPPAGGAHG